MAAAFPSWAKTEAVYQVYPRSFQDSDGDGIGDLPGLVARLDTLVDLGVGVVWLSPVHPSPQADFGYDVADYCDVDPVFGTLADMDALIAACHARGLRVFLDGVFNHTSDQHPWFQASRRGHDDPKRDWYLWRDRPNNWASTFGGSAWARDGAQAYLHTFLPQQPDLNWRNPEVVEAVLDVLRFWFARGVDGFRLDVFNCYRKHPELPDNPRRWHPGALFYPYVGQHHVHDRDQDDLREVLERMRAVADAAGAVLVGETMDERFRYDKAGDYVGAGQLHMAFHFGLLHSRWRADRLVAGLQAHLEGLPPDGWPTWVLSNHDFPRHATRWGGGDARAKAAAVLALTLRGTPFLYQGEELGMPEARLARADIVDPPGQRFWPFFKGRDGARTPMQWSSDPQGGFTTGTPWLPVSPDAGTRNVETQRADEGSVWRLYQRCLRLRREDTVLREGEMDGLRADGAVLRFRRVHPEGIVEVAVNTSSRAVAVADLEGELLLSTVAAPEPGRLGPDEARVVRR